MSMSIGDADSNTGLAGAIFAQLKNLPGAQSSGTGSMMAQFSNAFATAIVNYLKGNAVAVISNSTAGLQTSTTAGNPTAAPALQQTIPIQ